MKKIILLAVMAFIAATSFAQSAKEVALQQAELDELNMKLLNMKPSKSAKKQAKALKKEGWTVMAGGQDMEHQITTSELYSYEKMADEEGNISLRYIMNTSMGTAGTYNAAYAMARYQAQQEIGARLETEIVALMEGEIDNEQHNAVSATTVEIFHEHSKGIMDQVLNNTLVPVAIYRRLPNGNYEVQVAVAFDKKEVATRLKRSLQLELELEGEEMMNGVDNMIREKF